jgi:hypothetical protein
VFERCLVEQLFENIINFESSSHEDENKLKMIFGSSFRMILKVSTRISAKSVLGLELKAISMYFK